MFPALKNAWVLKYSPKVPRPNPNGNGANKCTAAAQYAYKKQNILFTNFDHYTLTSLEIVINY